MNGSARPCFPWVGGKEKLLPYIQQVIPPDIVQFVDVFGGSGAVLLGLPPKSGRLDIYNDLDANLSNFFLCLKERPAALLREIGFLPFMSRETYSYYLYLLSHKEEHRLLYQQNLREEAAEIVDTQPLTEEENTLLQNALRRRAKLFDVDCAAKFFACIHGSYNGILGSYGVAPVQLGNFLPRVEQAARRLQKVAIENKGAYQIIAERDKENGLLYADPPYYQAEGLYMVVREKRRGKKHKNRQLKKMRQFHVRLWRYLAGCKGYVVVSYNDCPFIRQLYKDFYILAFSRNNPLSQKAGAQYGELIITNYDPRPYMAHQFTLFDGQLPKGEMELVHIPKTITVPKGRKDKINEE